MQIKKSLRPNQLISVIKGASMRSLVSVKWAAVRRDCMETCRLRVIAQKHSCTPTEVAIHTAAHWDWDAINTLCYMLSLTCVHDHTEKCFPCSFCYWVPVLESCEPPTSKATSAHLSLHLKTRPLCSAWCPHYPRTFRTPQKEKFRNAAVPVLVWKLQGSFFILGGQKQGCVEAMM